MALNKSLSETRARRKRLPTSEPRKSGHSEGVLEETTNDHPLGFNDQYFHAKTRPNFHLHREHSEMRQSWNLLSAFGKRAINCRVKWPPNTDSTLISAVIRQGNIGVSKIRFQANKAWVCRDHSCTLFPDIVMYGKCARWFLPCSSSLMGSTESWMGQSSIPHSGRTTWIKSREGWRWELQRQPILIEHDFKFGLKHHYQPRGVTHAQLLSTWLHFTSAKSKPQTSATGLGLNHSLSTHKLVSNWTVTVTYTQVSWAARSDRFLFSPGFTSFKRESRVKSPANHRITPREGVRRGPTTFSLLNLRRDWGQQTRELPMSKGATELLVVPLHRPVESLDLTRCSKNTQPERDDGSSGGGDVFLVLRSWHG